MQDFIPFFAVGHSSCTDVSNIPLFLTMFSWIDMRSQATHIAIECLSSTLSVYAA